LYPINAIDIRVYYANDIEMKQQLKIIPIAAFEDNYIWLIHDGQEAIVVDPGDAGPVISTIAQLNLELKAIFITHHHSDHIGGVPHLQATYPNVMTYAPNAETYAFDHIRLKDKDQININFSRLNIKLTFYIIDLKGHTLGHIAYYSPNLEAPIVFCGDTLFAAGCGRIFEGTPEDMLQSLKKLTDLPENTLIYCTHEYTEKNIAFALTLEPHNLKLIERAQLTKKLRAENLPTLPSFMALELATNPFLRCTQQTIKGAIHQENASELETFTSIRLLRNQY
jgi:hydroxyacylglutathione hydrolase